MNVEPRSVNKRKWAIVVIVLVALVASYPFSGTINHDLDRYIAFPFEQNQPYWYLYNCGGVLAFTSQTDFVYPSLSVNDSDFGKGYLSIQLNVAVTEGAAPTLGLQVMARGNITAGVAYFTLNIEEWKNNKPVLNEQTDASPYIVVGQNDRLNLELSQSGSNGLSADLTYQRSYGTTLWSANLPFTGSNLKMVEAATGVYGLGNGSKATFAPSSEAIFDQRLSADTNATSAKIGGNCGEGLDVTEETNNLLIQNVTSSLDSVSYTLLPKG